MRRFLKRGGISVVELIVVVVILGVLAAMAIPRFSRGAEAVAIDEVRQNLTVLRTAIDLYYQDHHAFPGQRGDGTPEGVACTEAAFVSQLMMYTDATGRVSNERSVEFAYGPYLKQGVPKCPVAQSSDARRVHVLGGASRPSFIDDANVSWVFNCETGYIAANSDGQGPEGVRYDRY